jgi:ankyrin repeat protein
MGFFSKFFDAGLHGAIKNGDVEKVTELLNNGSRPDEKSLDMNALMAAADFAHPAMVEILLQKGARVNDPNSEGKTALMFAAAGKGAKGEDKEERCLETVKLLLADGANVNARARRGQTALAFAAGAGHNQVKEFLSAHGAKE